jgi:hypothetical protein
MASRTSLLKSLTVAQLEELARRHDLSLPSGKKPERVAFLVDELPLSDAELETVVEGYKADKLIGKIRDARDYFLTRQVTVDHVSDDAVHLRVAGYNISINHLGTDLFAYQCDQRCKDWLYQVRRGRYPFCKHYAAAIAELIYQEHLEPDHEAINHFSRPLLSEVMELVEERRRMEGLVTTPGREIEQTLANLREDFLAIARRDEELARTKYHDTPERQFETMVEQAFQLLEFDTISRRKEQGWDLIVLGTLAIPPFIAVAEVKTAISGVYDYVVKQPDYLMRLKTYCTDMVRSRLYGAYCDHVRYFMLVAPDFPEESARLCSRFRHMTEGIKLAFMPAATLLHLVERYRKQPILTHTQMESLFDAEKALREEDVDQLFQRAEQELDMLVERARKDLHRRIERTADRTADACFIKFDMPTLGMILREVVKTLEQELVIVGKTTVGIESVHVKHDYYALWEPVLHGLVDEFVAILREESLLQERHTELKDDVMRFLELER